MLAISADENAELEQRLIQIVADSEIDDAEDTAFVFAAAMTIALRVSTFYFREECRKESVREGKAVVERLANQFIDQAATRQIYSGIQQAVSDDTVDFHTPIALARKLYGNIRSYGRFEGSIAVKERITDILNEVTDLDTEMTLEDIVFHHPNFRDRTHSVSLHGKGGSGKTHQFINLIRVILYGENGDETQPNPQPGHPGVIPYYVELNDIDEKTEGNNKILTALAIKLDISCTKLQEIIREYGSNVILFCDGLNEIPGDPVRETIAKNIYYLMETYGTRIVLSSRTDTAGLFNTLGRGTNRAVVSAKVRLLTPKQINRYFRKLRLSIRYQYVPGNTKVLLETVQGLSMYASMLKDDPNKIEFSNLGELMRAFCDRILRLDRMNCSGTALEFENVLSKVAFEMVRKERFQIKVPELVTLLTTEQNRILTEDKHAPLIFQNHGDQDYEFSHHNFRDYFAARYMVNRLYGTNEENLHEVISEIFTNDGATTNDELLQLCADLVKPGTVQNTIDLIREAGSSAYAFSLSKLIRIHALANRNSIAELNLSELDLRNVKLSGYKLYEKKYDRAQKMTLHMKQVILNGAYISENSFLQDGLQTASSTICKYSYEGTVYICAFSASNAQIYDTKDNKWICVRNLTFYGGVSCCCVSSENGLPYILVGSEQGVLSAFYPTEGRAKELQKFQGAGIESVFPAGGSDDAAAFILCTVDGSVYLYRKDAESRQQLHAMSPEQTEAAQKRFKTNGIKPACRMTVTENSVYLCYGAEILKCSLPLAEQPVFQLCYQIGDESSCIKDILNLNGALLLNLVDRLSLLVSPETDPHITEPLIFRPEQNADEKHRAESLLYFTKLSRYEFGDGIQRALVGIKAKQNDYTYLPNFMIAEVESPTIDLRTGQQTYTLSWKPLEGEQTLATYTGVTFRQDRKKTFYIATVSDDRSVQLIASTPSKKTVKTSLLPGSYDGIHDLEVVYPTCVFAAMYDGSVSQWFKAPNRDAAWSCVDVFHIHNSWVWKVKHFHLGDNLFFISCSYDGTVKAVNTKTGEEKLLLDVGTVSAREPVLDFVFDNDQKKISSLTAVTQKRVYHRSRDNKISVYTYQSENPAETYFFRSAAALKNGRPYIAAKSESGCRILSLTDSGLVQELQTEPTCEYIRVLKLIREEQTQTEIMLIGGNHSDQSGNNKLFYLAVCLKKDGAAWEYRGSIFPTEVNQDAVRFSSADKSVTLQTVQSYEEVNDICVTDLRAEDNDICFTLGVTHKDKRLSAYAVRIGEQTTLFKHLYTFLLRFQPLTVTAIGDGSSKDYLIGMLNGEAVRLNDSLSPAAAFQTHAGLGTCCNVMLNNVRFSEDIDKNASQQEKFRGTFSGYFTM